MACDWLILKRQEAISGALGYLQRMRLPSNAAMVFDIDHTLIDDAGLPIDPVVYLFNYAKTNGITPFIITARQGEPDVVKWTQTQLRGMGIFGYESMYLMHPKKTDPWRFKKTARQNIHEKGYITVMTVGDEPWDHGEYGGYSVMMPKCFCGVQIRNDYFV